MAVWNVFLHTIVYCLVIVALTALNGTLKDVVSGWDKPVASAPSVEAVADVDDADENIFFSSYIDEGALTSYIKSDPNKFTSGEDMAIFFLIMCDMSYIGTSKKKFHEFLSSLIDCHNEPKIPN